MKSRQIILLKLTGNVLQLTPQGSYDSSLVRSIAQQIRQINQTHYFGIVIGGGNFFRGNQQGVELGLSASMGHNVGMLATMMNGLIIKNLFEQEGVPSTLLSAIPSPEIGSAISNQTIKNALEKDNCVIFAGGTGNPFFTTDTTAVLRGLQIEAKSIWKGTNVDGIFSEDPRCVVHASLLKRVSYQEALQNKLKILDATAFTLAQEHHLKIRVFNIFKNNALIHASQDDTFGSIVE